MTKFGPLGCTLKEFDELVHNALSLTTADARYEARKEVVKVEVVDSIHRLYVIYDMKVVKGKLVIEITPEF
jgi:hypothetical protein